MWIRTVVVSVSEGHVTSHVLGVPDAGLSDVSVSISQPD
jgi:hypothetical protein